MDEQVSGRMPPPRGGRAAGGSRNGVTPGMAAAVATPIAIVILVAFLPIWVWFWWRIEPDKNGIAILTHKTGRNLPSGQILALEPGEKGIQLEVLPAGRYFRNPYSWGWEMGSVTDIPAGKLGVRTRLYGRELPPGHIIAEEGFKGIVREVLGPGKYFVNPYGYRVDLFDAINIRAGCVGVVTSQVGLDVLRGDAPAEGRNGYLVSADTKGVQATVLAPGTYYLNPYLVSVVEVNLQSQRFEMSGEDSISFLTADGFTITVEGTIEYALAAEQVAMLTHKVGDMDDVLKKIILPRARGFSRIEGSKHPAKNFITGDTRQQFQNNLEEHLRRMCADWGIGIKSVLIRNIAPPEEIASVIRDREVAVQTARKYDQQLEQARSKAELTRQEMLAVQNKEKVETDTVRIRAVIKARQEQAVRVTAANRELEVAKLERDAAVAQAAAILSRAEADRSVVRMRNEADAAVIAGKVQAFGDGMNFARYAFYERLAPRIKSVLSADGQGGLGEIFAPYLPPRKEAQP
jgi:regulator of protease activity HflC (stomatin/prohibitin superfamily)